MWSWTTTAYGASRASSSTDGSVVRSTAKPFSAARASKRGGAFSIIGVWLGSLDASTSTRNSGGRAGRAALAPSGPSARARRSAVGPPTWVIRTDVVTRHLRLAASQLRPVPARAPLRGRCGYTGTRGAPTRAETSSALRRHGGAGGGRGGRSPGPAARRCGHGRAVDRPPPLGRRAHRRRRAGARRPHRRAPRAGRREPARGRSALLARALSGGRARPAVRALERPHLLGRPTV